jgi:sulfur-oxidizing protein SoxY
VFRRIRLAATVKSRFPDTGISQGKLVDAKRREVLKTGGGVLALAAAAGIIKPGEALAQEWNKAAFETKSVAETVKALGGGGSTPSSAIEITAPDIAENGAVVPIAVESKLPKTQAIAILIEKNPNTLSAEFDIPSGTDPFVSTRVKMGETSNVYALVIADGKYFHATKEIKVTIGGCGG